MKTRVEKRSKDKNSSRGGGSGSSGGAPKGNRNAAKIGEDLRFEMFLSKPRRMFFEEWFNLRFGRPHLNENELRDAARQLANNAIDRAIVEEFERHHPGRTNSGGEVF
jgi:hypothetical protein